MSFGHRPVSWLNYEHQFSGRRTPGFAKTRRTRGASQIQHLSLTTPTWWYPEQDGFVEVDAKEVETTVVQSADPDMSCPPEMDSSSHRSRDVAVIPAISRECEDSEGRRWTALAAGGTLNGGTVDGAVFLPGGFFATAVVVWHVGHVGARAVLLRRQINTTSVEIRRYEPLKCAVAATANYNAARVWPTDGRPFTSGGSPQSFLCQPPGGHQKAVTDSRPTTPLCLVVNIDFRRRIDVGGAARHSSACLVLPRRTTDGSRRRSGVDYIGLNVADCSTRSDKALEMPTCHYIPWCPSVSIDLILQPHAAITGTSACVLACLEAASRASPPRIQYTLGLDSVAIDPFSKPMRCWGHGLVPLLTSDGRLTKGRYLEVAGTKDHEE
ncbi:hypothetical protein CPLU01_01875 [Colletotrichum plurivorum]|uniref:Uncharacterized protein n=1 Tax=Colletotrichum plurivorum TaxID=2175906 RepID=A0A8H6KXM9_9PEZI|nr:hypothetical protein CPLU01_01875 [Colletotrichum plurivorum]